MEASMGERLGNERLQAMDELLEALGLDEEPMGVEFSDQCPENGLQPKPGILPTRTMEAAGELDWSTLQAGFSCAMGHIWRARKKRAAACFSAERFGCLGAAFWMGFSGLSTEAQLHYVTQGERYLNTCDDMRRITDEVAPGPEPDSLPGKYVVVKPVSQFTDQPPLVAAFFARPESLAGLHQLAAFVTSDPEVVASPWGPGCGGIITWPMYYLRQGLSRAVLGGWDPSARKYYKTDELSFTVPHAMFTDMLTRWKDSFLKRPVWTISRKKAERSSRAWGEIE